MILKNLESPQHYEGFLLPDLTSFKKSNRIFNLKCSFEFKQS